MADSRHPLSDPRHHPGQQFDEAFAAAARFREPSAAERARKPGWLARRRAARLAPGAGSLRGRGRVRTAVTTTLTLLLFLGVLGVAGWAIRLGLMQHSPVPLAPSPTHRATPAAATARPSPRLAADPFAGSPAESYATGAAGIVPPPPHALGPYSKAQVARAYALTKQLLIAAHLNRHIMSGGRPTAFARLLAPAERRIFLRRLNDTGVSKQGYEQSTRAWVTAFAPGTTQLATSVIKVHGRMSAHVAHQSGQPMLRIGTDYLFVYAVQRPGQPWSRVRIVLQDASVVDFAPWDNPGGPLEPWWGARGGGAAGGSCDYNDGYIHPVYRSGSPGRVRPSGKPVDPYSLAVPTGQQGCRPVTRT